MQGLPLPSPSYLSVKWAGECSRQSCVPSNVISRGALTLGGWAPIGLEQEQSRLIALPSSWEGTLCPRCPCGVWQPLMACALPPSRDGLQAQPGTRQGLEVRKEVLSNAGQSRRAGLKPCRGDGWGWSP